MCKNLHFSCKLPLTCVAYKHGSVRKEPYFNFRINTIRIGKSLDFVWLWGEKERRLDWTKTMHQFHDHNKEYEIKLGTWFKFIYEKFEKDFKGSIKGDLTVFFKDFSKIQNDILVVVCTKHLICYLCSPLI